MANKKLKIRYQITHFHPIYTGAGKSLEKLIDGMDKTVFDLEVLTSYQKGLPRKEIKEGYTIRRVGLGGGTDSMNRLSSMGKLSFALFAFIYNLFRPFDLIKFIGVGNIAFPSILVAKLYRKPIVEKVTGVGDDDPAKLSDSIIGKWIIRLLKKKAGHWIISEEIYDLCKEATEWDQLHLIPNPVLVPYKEYEQLRKEREVLANEEIVFLAVGVLNKRKGTHVLLRTWEEYKIKHKLILCGPMGKDIEVEYLLKQVHNPNIEWIGEKSPEEVKLLYLNSDFLLFPSNREGLPNVVLEAMSVGIPVIAYKIPGVTDFLLGLNNERGICIPNLEPENWVKEIKRAAELPQLDEERAERAFEWIIEKADRTVVCEKWENIYLKMIHEKN